ncbi:MAG: ribonuclease Y [Chloroflexi bacterium]|nr:ribonuclease Y [Chloroflexota bacterium]
MLENLIVPVLVGVAALATGGAAGFWARHIILLRKVRAAQEEAERTLAEAKTKQKEILLEAKEETIKLRATMESELKERRVELQRLERRVIQREENLERRGESLERRERTLTNKEKESENLRHQAEEMKNKQFKELQRVSNLSEEEAKKLLLASLGDEIKEEAARRLREMEAQLKEESDRLARDILSTALQRCAAEVVAETSVSVVPLPSDDMKGRIIGREGRNIRALENATGVDLIIDDTPDAVTLSAFDPVRREVARVALTKLVSDGRIHPARIEEMVQKAKNEVEQSIRIDGEQATQAAKVQGIHPELIKLLGRLKYRYSYGQNVLQHSVEVAQLAGMIAAELGADVAVAKKAGLLHDIGKAVDHEVEGPHALIGAELAKRYGKSPEVIQAIGGHHGENGTMSIEALIVGAADAVSSARPGARRESVEHYVKRLQALEEVANSFGGVEKSFAIQAGREIRILVKPEEVDDLGALRLARDIVKKIEETLEYPGQIKVIVVRETRAVEYAK